MADAGHNSGVAGDEIRQFVERIERMEDEISTARMDLSEIYKEAKGRGYDTKALRRIIRTRKKDPEKLAEEMAIVELYGATLGMDVFA